MILKMKMEMKLKMIIKTKTKIEPFYFDIHHLKQGSNPEDKYLIDHHKYQAYE